MAQFYRKPKNYDGTSVTSHRVSDLLPSILSSLLDVQRDRPDLILAVWPEVIGSKLAAMTEAVSFVDGVLLVKVKNSTLHSILSLHDKPKILAKLKNKFPSVQFREVFFRRA